MPDKEFTIDENTKALTFAEDRLPVVVKYNGNTIEGMSALTKNVNNTDTSTNKVSYTSEYNKSLMSFDVNGSTVQNIPPSQYTLKEYIEMSTGDGAWLNTPLIINNNLKLKYKANVWVGTTFNGSKVFNIATDSTTLISLNINGTTVVSGIPKVDNGYVVEIDMPNSSVTINDTVYDISEYLPLSDTTTTFGIGRRSDNPHYTYGVHRVSSFKGTDSVNQCDLIPCVDTNGSISGFYDLCSNTFKTTSGSYKFTSGGTYSLPEPNKPIPIQNANDNGMLLKLNDTYITIPKSITLNGENVPLLFSEYDKLTVDRINNKVIYTKGSYTVSLTENSYFYLNPQGGINYYHWRVANSSNYILYSGYCSHFPRKPWWPIQSNYAYSITSGTGYTNIAFRTDGKQTLQEFKEYIKTIAPVYVIAQLRTPTEYDITNTDLGILILDLTNKIPYGTIYLEVSSELTVPISVNYAKWGGISDE